MNLEAVLKFFPWVVAALMALAAATCLHLYQSERDEFVSYKAKAEQKAEDQRQAVELAKAQGEDNLKSLRDKYEKDLPEVKRLAVANYVAWLRKQSAMQPSSQPNASGKPVDDGAQQEPVVDPGTAQVIGVCGEDARKLEAWIEYCTVNHCPVKE